MRTSKTDRRKGLNLPTTNKSSQPVLFAKKNNNKKNFGSTSKQNKICQTRKGTPEHIRQVRSAFCKFS